MSLLKEARPRDPGDGDLLGGRYRLLNLVGRGGMGLVYAARELKTARMRAVKVLQRRFCADPALVERFHRESATTALLHHENIIEVFDYGEAEDGQPWYAMEWLEGETLEVTLRKAGPMQWTRVRTFALQICDALVYAHQIGVVHRDLKLTNFIRISRNSDHDTVKVLDFGIAKALHDPAPALTPAGIAYGSPGYAAPEQFDGRRIDETADIYAMGVVLYQMLTGRMPFAGNSLAEILSQQMTRTPRSIRDLIPGTDVPTHIEVAILSTLRAKPEDRPESMDTLREVLAEVSTPRFGAPRRHDSEGRHLLLGRETVREQNSAPGLEPGEGERQRAPDEAHTPGHEHMFREAHTQVAEDKRHGRPPWWLRWASLSVAAGVILGSAPQDIEFQPLPGATVLASPSERISGSRPQANSPSVSEPGRSPAPDLAAASPAQPATSPAPASSETMSTPVVDDTQLREAPREVEHRGSPRRAASRPRPPESGAHPTPASTTDQAPEVTPPLRPIQASLEQSAQKRFDAQYRVFRACACEVFDGFAEETSVRVEIDLQTARLVPRVSSYSTDHRYKRCQETFEQQVSDIEVGVGEGILRQAYSLSCQGP